MRTEMRGGLVWMCMLAPTVVAAQSTPEAQPPASQGAEASTETSVTPPLHWSMEVGLRGGFDDNPRFNTEQPEGSWLGGFQGKGSYTGTFSKGTLGLSGDASMLRYKDASDLNQFTYSGLGLGNFKLSPRTTFQFSQVYTSTLTGYAKALTDEGLVLPQVLVHRLDTTANLSRQATPQTSLGANLRYERNSFPNGELVDGSEFGIGASGTRRLNAKHNVSAAYTFEISASQGQQLDRHVLSGGWNAVLRPRLSAGATLGAVNYETVANGDRRWSPEGTASLSWAYPRWTVDARYTHSVSQAFGLGRDRLADVASLTVARKVSKTVDLGGSYVYSLNRDPSDDTAQFTSQAYGADLRWLFTRKFVASLAYAGRRNDQASAAQPFTGNVFTCAISYKRDWR